VVALGLIACALFGFALLSRRVEGTVVTGVDSAGLSDRIPSYPTARAAVGAFAHEHA
jgi:hypothetical protein